MKRFKSIKSISPVLFPYTDRYSVRADSAQDLLISHKAKIIGKDNVARKPAIGDDTLVVGKKPDGFHIFTAKVSHWVDDERKDIWYKKGGNRWKINYEITKATEPVFLTKEDIQTITGASDKDLSRLFVDQFGTDDPNSKIAHLGDFRKKLVDYLRS